MSEPAVDVNSKTSLAKRLWALVVADADKAMRAYTSPLNWAFMALSVWMYVGPFFAHQGAQQANAQVAQLQQDLTNAIGREATANLAADKNRAAYEAVEQDRALLAAELDAIRAAKGQPKQEASLTPPVVKVKVRKVPVSPKADPTTWEQFVAWYEKNVGAPGVN